MRNGRLQEAYGMTVGDPVNARQENKLVPIYVPAEDAEHLPSNGKKKKEDKDSDEMAAKGRARNPCS
jgi:hypothetical protein